jgi:RNA polymerase sigma factor (sigma-70 family)
MCTLAEQSRALTGRRGPTRDSRADDERLMAGICNKDIDAFEELYRAYHTRLSRFLFKLIHRPTLVEEVLNDTLMVVWDRGHSFNGESKLSTWIFAISYRKAMKALRGQDEAVEDKRADERVSLDAGPEEEFGHHRRHVLLMKAIGELSPEHRAVVDFTYFHDMGYREIASIMGCPIDTIKTRMFHARRHLKRRLAGELPDWL